MYDEKVIRKLIHDHNNLMSRIVAACNFLEMSAKENDQEYIDLIVDSVKEMDRLNKEVLNK